MSAACVLEPCSRSASSPPHAPRTAAPRTPTGRCRSAAAFIFRLVRFLAGAAQISRLAVPARRVRRRTPPAPPPASPARFPLRALAHAGSECPAPHAGPRPQVAHARASPRAAPRSFAPTPRLPGSRSPSSGIKLRALRGDSSSSRSRSRFAGTSSLHHSSTQHTPSPRRRRTSGSRSLAVPAAYNTRRGGGSPPLARLRARARDADVRAVARGRGGRPPPRRREARLPRASVASRHERAPLLRRPPPARRARRRPGLDVRARQPPRGGYLGARLGAVRGRRLGRDDVPVESRRRDDAPRRLRPAARLESPDDGSCGLRRLLRDAPRRAARDTPPTCYEANGYTILAEETIPVDAASGLRVRELFVEMDGERRLAHFWYRARGTTGSSTGSASASSA